MYDAERCKELGVKIPDGYTAIKNKNKTYGESVMDIVSYFSSLDFMSFLNALPGNIAQGIIWGLMGLGVFITYKLLHFADLSVDGSFATGGAVTAIMLINGCPIWVAMLVAVAAGLLAGLVTGLLHTLLGIPDILSGILTQIALYSINLNIMGNQTFQ